ncbi:dihydropteroate synthase [Streptomyces sp. A7024]|uniref:Dihydropteroate synthase n=1 Tax=Streptomyces coryli TaxID=1128680 RepID=A0A6G4UBW2_9ACTN|nr:dihydropteroate synthase [Streptomyces coryli]
MGRPRVVGIVNITADSFSDGGRYLAADDAVAHARRLWAQGADLVELGPASSHPDAEQVGGAEELRRLAPVLERLVAEGVPVAVDSYLPETQRFAAAHGAACLNDIQGFPDPARYAELAASDCTLVVMHSVQRVGPATRVATDAEAVWWGIERFFAERLAALTAAGIGRERLVIDPGLGYFLGAAPGPSLTALARVRRLKERFGVPVLVSPSRKSFLRAVTGRPPAEAGPATLAAELYAALRGVDYLRTHDVGALRDALAVFAALEDAGRGAPAGPEEV